QCHLIIVLARGRLVFYGPPAEAPGYFKVKRISDVYDRIAEREVTDWVSEFEQSGFHQEYVRDRQDAIGESQRGAVSMPAPASTPSAPSKPVSLPAGLSESRQLVGLSKQPPLAERFR